MSLKKLTVLVVDDDVRILRMVRQILELEGYRVLTAGDGETALRTFDVESPDLILLDIMLPDMDGYKVCQCIREFSQVPVIMVTAKSDDEEKVAGLNIGADDYVTKPFSSRELTARVKAILRRSELSDERPEPAFRLNDLAVDFTLRKVAVGREQVSLTATEYRILTYLARNAGRVITLDTILRHVWGEAYEGESHLLQVNIARLRKKIGDNIKKPRYVITRPGIGYTMSKQA